MFSQSASLYPPRLRQRLLRKQFESSAVRAQRRSDSSLIASPRATMQNIATSIPRRHPLARTREVAIGCSNRRRSYRGDYCRSNSFYFANTTFSILRSSHAGFGLSTTSQDEAVSKSEQFCTREEFQIRGSRFKVYSN